MGFWRLLLFGLVVYFVWRALRGLLKGRGTEPPESPHRPNANANSRATPNAYEVLGVSANATPQEIRAAYQRLIQQYHPDRVAGLGPELREVAERRSKEINAAYEELKRNWNG